MPDGETVESEAASHAQMRTLCRQGDAAYLRALIAAGHLKAGLSALQGREGSGLLRNATQPPPPPGGGQNLSDRSLWDRHGLGRCITVLFGPKNVERLMGARGRQSKNEAE